MKPDTAFPGIAALLFLAALILFIAFCTIGCAQTTLYRDGRKIFNGQGDMTGMRYVHHADGSCELTSETIDHSSATLAQGKAAEGKIAAVGTGLAASGLTYLFK